MKENVSWGCAEQLSASRGCKTWRPKRRIRISRRLQRLGKPSGSRLTHPGLMGRTVLDTRKLWKIPFVVWDVPEVRRSRPHQIEIRAWDRTCTRRTQSQHLLMANLLSGIQSELFHKALVSFRSPTFVCCFDTPKMQFQEQLVVH